MAKKLVIKGSTTDSEIATSLTPEEILGRFTTSKAQANIWDAERDRLRSFIQEHMTSGRYGNLVLELSQGTARVYASSTGNAMLQTGVILDMGLIPKPIKGGTSVIIVNADTGEELGRGKVVANDACFSKKPPTTVKIMEVPEEVAD
mgnify:CR=1 FL=1